MKKIKVLSLCDGVASGLEALIRVGFKREWVEYHAIEIEEYKRAIADANHEGIIRPSNDVVEFSDSVNFEPYDLILCGFTCKSLTSQGSRKDWDGESKIFFNCLEIVNGVKEINPRLLFFFENVSSMKNVIREEISRLLQANYFLGEAGLVSAQDRNRYYWFNWAHPEIKTVEVEPITMLDEDALAVFSFSKSNRNKKGEPAIVEGRFKANGKVGTLVTGTGCKGQSTMTQVITKKMKVRDLRPLECARLQGLPNYVWPCSAKQIYDAIGEGWQMEMITTIFSKSPPLIRMLENLAILNHSKV